MSLSKTDNKMELPSHRKATERFLKCIQLQINAETKGLFFPYFLFLEEKDPQNINFMRINTDFLAHQSPEIFWVGSNTD